MLRIIAGEWKGKPLKTVRGKNTRPTSDRVKEAIFNIIRFHIQDSVVLDLFAGTGNLGLEALSRGSLRAVFVEKSKDAVSVLRDNCAALGYLNKSRIIAKDVFRSLAELAREEEVFDVIFVDPPYRKGFEVPVLESISRNKILDENGIVIVEHHAGDVPPERIDELFKYDSRRYGSTCVSFYRKEG